MNDPIKNPSLDFENSVNDFACSKSLNRNGCNRGFTLLEVLIVIAIIGIMSAIAVPNYIKYRYEALITVGITDIRMIEKQIALFVFDNNGQFPNSLNDLTTIGTVNDPWGNPYRYLRINGGLPSAAGQARKDHFMVPVNTDYDLYSMGVNGQSQPAFTAARSQDDIVRANDGGYVGLVSNY
jgi:general secretion pathway protein G